MTKIDQYVQLFKTLLPKGKAWNKESGSTLDKFLFGLAEELVRSDNQIAKLLSETDPRTSTELLPEWESAVGLPDECQEISESIGERRNDVFRKFSTAGGQSPQYFIDLAATFGYTVTIRNLLSFRAGRGRAGDQIWGWDFRFYWEVYSDDVTPVFFRAGQSVAGNPLRLYRNEILECVIRRAAPAHTHPVFAYGDGGA